MKHLALISVVGLTCWLASDVTEAYPKGAPDSTCVGLVPSPRKHKATPSEKPSPYILDVQVDKDRLKLTVKLFDKYPCHLPTDHWVYVDPE